MTDLLAMHTKVHLHFTPTYSSSLNQVELWFSKIDHDVIAREYPDASLAGSHSPHKRTACSLKVRPGDLLKPRVNLHSGWVYLMLFAFKVL